MRNYKLEPEFQSSGLAAAYVARRSEYLAAQEIKYSFVHKRGDWSPLSKCRGFGVYSMNKTWCRRKMFITIGSVPQAE